LSEVSSEVISLPTTCKEVGSEAATSFLSSVGVMVVVAGLAAPTLGFLGKLFFLAAALAAATRAAASVGLRASVEEAGLLVAGASLVLGF